MWLASRAICERKFYERCRIEIIALREEVQTWKDRFFADRQDHEATMNAWDKDRSRLGEP